MAEADLWPSASSEYDSPAPFPSPVALLPTQVRGSAKLQYQYPTPTPSAIQSTVARPNTGASPPSSIPFPSSTIDTTTFEPVLEDGRTPKEPPSPPIPRKPPYRTQLQAITNRQGHLHHSSKLVKHRRRNQDTDRGVEHSANQRPVPGTAAIEQQHEAHQKAQGQRSGQAGNRTCGGTKMQHPSRLRHHRSTAAKVTKERVTTLQPQSAMPCWTMLPAPDYTCSNPKFVPNFPVDRSDTTSATTVSTDSYQWEQMRTFHALLFTRDPPFPTCDTTVTGESALSWTMSMPSLDTAWRRTYAWTEERKFQSVAPSAPVHLPRLSLAMWNHRLGPNQTNWTKGAEYWDHARRSQKRQAKLAHSMPQSSPEHPQSWQTSPDTQQWEKKRAFHSSYRLWPAMVQPNPVRAEGESPLIWTTLHPPLATVRLQTYAWDGHLDYFMPWNMSNPNGATRPPLVSHAMWNIRTGSNLQQAWLTDTPAQTADAVVHLPTPCSPAHKKIPRPSAPRSNNFVRAALVVYLFLAWPSSNIRHTEKLCTPPLVNRFPHPRLVHNVKTRKSCYRWTTTVIQQAWNTAWDLTTHRNVEGAGLGLAYPYVRG